LRHRYYPPIFYMVQKLRLVMGKRDSLYQLEGLCELDEGYFSNTDSLELNEFTGKQEELKRGKGSQKKACVLVTHSVKQANLTLKKSEYKHETIPMYIKMTVLDDEKAETFVKYTQETICENSRLKTDDHRAYTKLKNIVRIHQPHNMKKEDPGKILPWVHKAISNSKANLWAIYHGVSNAYLQNYLNEYCFKYNRRGFGEKLIERLIIAAVNTTWY
ncbi:MAG: IS1595 family transposase, partial [Dolichospermum sp.]